MDFGGGVLMRELIAYQALGRSIYQHWHDVEIVGALKFIDKNKHSTTGPPRHEIRNTTQAPHSQVFEISTRAFPLLGDISSGRQADGRLQIHNTLPNSENWVVITIHAPRDIIRT